MLYNSKGALPRAASAFALTGCVLSFLAAALMLGLLGTNPDARREVNCSALPSIDRSHNHQNMMQVRPRMLIVLAALDLAAAFFLGVASVPAVQFAENQLFDNIFWNGLGDFFMFSSWTWTCAIAYHGTSAL